MSKEISITIPRADIDRWNHDIHVANTVMEQLKAKGAPVKGALFPVSVERGTLTFEDDAFGDLCVTWRDA
jgi:hypothetical protein